MLLLLCELSLIYLRAGRQAGTLQGWKRLLLFLSEPEPQQTSTGNQHFPQSSRSALVCFSKHISHITPNSLPLKWRMKDFVNILDLSTTVSLIAFISTGYASRLQCQLLYLADYSKPPFLPHCLSSFTKGQVQIQNSTEISEKVAYNQILTIYSFYNPVSAQLENIRGKKATERQYADNWTKDTIFISDTLFFLICFFHFHFRCGDNVIYIWQLL